MATGGWAPVQATLVSGIAGLYHRLHDARSSHEFRGTVADAYIRGDPLVSAVAVAILLSIICWALSIGTHKHSWVDKLWSIVPIFYVAHFASHAKTTGADPELDPRLLILTTLVSVWGVRLTYNFARKGGYRWTDEDYRWPIIRRQVHPVLFEIFSLVFIAFIQNILLLAITAPAYVAWQYRGKVPLNWIDGVATALLAGFIVLETVADQQQWTFQTAKHAKKAEGKRLTGDYHKGFLTSGLFKYSRHPNFFAEQAIWWSVYLFSVAASGAWLNWSAAGAAALTALFQGSTWLTEKLTAEKYPKYADYQATTSRLIPWWPFKPAPKKRGRPAGRRGAEGEGAAPATPATPRRRGRRRSSIGASPEAGSDADPDDSPYAPSAAVAGAAAAAVLPDAPATSTRSRSRRRAGAGSGNGESEEGGASAPEAISPRARRSGRAAATPRRSGRGE